jgi:hypothetical protein
MGRPIKKRYFGNTNTGSATTRADDGIGGEGVASVVVNTSGTLYTSGSVPVFSAPQIVGGVRPTASVTVNSAGSIATINILDQGSGYTSAPTITSITSATQKNVTVTAVSGNYTLTNVSSVVGILVGMRIDGSPGVQAASYVTAVSANTITLSKNMTASTSTNSYQFSDVGSGFVAGTIALTSNQQNAILFTSWVPTASNGAVNSGGSAVSGGDIVKQTGSKRYYVRNTQGYGVCTLTTGTVTRGKLEMTVTDWNGNIYNVARLQQRKLTVWRKTQNGSNAWVYLNGDVARWANGALATGTNRLLVTTNVNLTRG